MFHVKHSVKYEKMAKFLLQLETKCDIIVIV